MKEKTINGKALYSPKGAAREYAAVGCNFYVGCPHDCEYCYLKRGVLAPQLGGNVVQLKKCFKDEEDALAVFEKELNDNLSYLKEVGIFFSFTTDPLISETRGLTMLTTQRAVNNDVPVTLLTKDASFIHNEAFNAWAASLSEDERRFVAFGFTLTGRDDMEPNASTNQERIEAMHYLKDCGFRIWASIEPIIQFNKSLAMIQESVIYCNHFKIGLRSGVSKDYYDDEELHEFVRNVHMALVDAEREHMANPTVYWKESVRKRYGSDLMEQDRFAVDIDYNIFAYD